MNYHAYIFSKAWRGRRGRELLRVDYCCEFCGYQVGSLEDSGDCYLQVHHLSYERLGNEAQEDLIVLCNFCHADVHDYEQIKKGVAGLAARRTFFKPELEEWAA